jgi:hypothetical protein
VVTDPPEAFIDARLGRGAGGTNLLDERYLITGQAQIGGGQIYGTFGRPEEWYFSARYRH